VVAAVARGSGRFTCSLIGDDSRATTLASAFRSAAWQTERRIGVAAVALFSFASYFAFVALIPVEGGGPRWLYLAQSLVSGAAGALSSAFFVRWVPTVGLAETATRERVRRIAGQTVMIILGALVGAAVRLVLGR
jgi:hypothetical protein